MGTEKEADWRSCEAMPTTRHDVGCVVVDDELLVVSGFDDDTNYETTESYATGRGEWDQWRKPIPVARGLFGAERDDDSLYVVGGKRLRGAFIEHGTGPQYDVFGAVHRYRLSADEWEQLSPMTAPRAGLGAVKARGRLYAVGGSIPANPDTFPKPADVTDLVERYDPDEDAWVAGPPLPEPRMSPTVETVGSRVYAIGGSVDGRPRSEIFALDPGNGTWSTVGSLDVPRRDAASAVYDGAIYLFGGFSTDEMYLRSVVRYDPATGAVDSLPDLPTAKAWAGGAINAGRAYVVGGARRDPGADEFEFLAELHELDLSAH
jgi:N-acetylneuraminic acid mutarotase